MTPPRGGALGRALAAAMLAQAMAAMAVNTIPVLAPALAATFGVSAGWIGVYSSLALAGGVGSGLIGGALARRIGAVRCSQAALIAAAAGLALTAAAPLPGIALLAVATGMGYGLAAPAAGHLLARATPLGRRGAVMSLRQSAAPLGGLAAGLLAPAAAIPFGWRGAALCAAALPAAAAVAIAPLRARFDDDRAAEFPVFIRSPLHAIGAALATPRLRLLAVASFAFAANQSALFAVFTAFLVEVGGLDLLRAGQAFAAMQIAGAASRAAFGRLRDRWILARMCLQLFPAGMVLMLIIATGIDSSRSFAEIIAFAVAVGAVAAGWPGVYLAEIVRLVPADRVGAATGGTVGFSFLGMALGPGVFGILAAVGGYTLAFHTFMIMTMLVGSLIMFATDRENALR